MVNSSEPQFQGGARILCRAGSKVAGKRWRSAQAALRVGIKEAAHWPAAARLGPREVGEPMYKVEGHVVRGHVFRLEECLE